MKSMVVLLTSVDDATEDEIIVCYNHEREINNMRNTLRMANVASINEHDYEYQSGIYYMDIVSTLEKTGDYIINVVDTVKNEYKYIHHRK